MASAGVSEVLSQIADGVLAVPPTAFGALGALGLIGAALFVADPEKRYTSWLLLNVTGMHLVAAASCSLGQLKCKPRQHSMFKVTRGCSAFSMTLFRSAERIF